MMKGTLIALAAICIGSSVQARDQQRSRRQFEDLIRMVAAAQAIEASCPGYKTSPQFAAVLAALEQPAKPGFAKKDVADRVRSAMADSGVKYGAKRDPNGFCERILADHGPTSPNPVVVLELK